MPRLIRGGRDDGIAGLLVTIFVGSAVLVGMLALVIDVGRLVAERRQLQNGAEAAVISAAYDCSMGLASCNNWSTTATYNPTGVTPAELASRDAIDNAAALRSYCGHDKNGALTGCPSPHAADRDCPTQPSLGSDWVQIKTQTRTSSGLSKVPSIFAQAIMPGYTGSTISACAQAAWGAPGAFDGVIGIAIDKQCWDAWIGGNQGSYGPGTYSNGTAQIFEQILRFGGGNSISGNCVGSSINSMGFGWLDTVEGCNVNQDPATRPNAYGGWLQGDGGDNIPSPAGQTITCKSRINALATAGFERTKLAVPIFDCVYKLGGSGGNCPTGIGLPANPASGKVYYHIVGYATWYLSGYFASNSDNFRFPKSTAQDYTYTHLAATCGSSATCIAGWFARTTLLAKATIGSANGQTDYGLNVVQLVG